LLPFFPTGPHEQPRPLDLEGRMPTSRTHTITVDDGAQIAGRVRGEGPNLLLVHGALEDGDSVWGELAFLLEDRFICHLMYVRGSGSSSDHPDVRPQRLARDVGGYARSIGGPVGVVAESGGCMSALGAAAETDVIGALALHEPVVLEVQTDEEASAVAGSMTARVWESESLLVVPPV
jgi:pimeloyl-ACP methyl ester carboxylesterase